MKTSNKLLLIAFVLILSGTFYIIYKAKTFIEVSPNDHMVSARDLNLSGKTREKIVPISEFENLRVSGGIKAQLIHGNENKLVLRGDTVLLNYVEIEEYDHALSIRQTTVKGKRMDVEVDIITTNLEISDIKVNAGGQLNSKELITAKDLHVEANAGGNFNIRVEAESVSCSSNAGAHATLEGNTNDFSGRANAGASINAVDLKAEKVRIRANAGASASVYATQTIEAKCVAGGHVDYAGNPEKESKTTTAGGSISKIKQ